MIKFELISNQSIESYQLQLIYCQQRLRTAKSNRLLDCIMNNKKQPDSIKIKTTNSGASVPHPLVFGALIAMNFNIPSNSSKATGRVKSRPDKERAHSKTPNCTRLPHSSILRSRLHSRYSPSRIPKKCLRIDPKIRSDCEATTSVEQECNLFRWFARISLWQSASDRPRQSPSVLVGWICSKRCLHKKQKHLGGLTGLLRLSSKYLASPRLRQHSPPLCSYLCRISRKARSYPCFCPRPMNTGSNECLELNQVSWRKQLEWGGVSPV